MKRLGIARVSGLGSFVEALKLADSIGALDDYNIVFVLFRGRQASSPIVQAPHLRFPDLHEAQKQTG